MGTFTNQVQGLVSEEKQKRTEREQAKRRKRDVDHLKFQLKLSFETAFETLTIFGRDKKYKCNDVNDVYLHLLKSNIRDDVIYKVIAKQSWDDEELVRAIDNVYMSILTKAYFPYKQTQTITQSKEREQAKKQKQLEQQRKEIKKKEIQKQKEQQRNYEPYRNILDNGEHLQPKEEKSNKSKKIFFVIIYSLICFFKYILYPPNQKKGNKRK